ncbi:MAG: phosphoribosyltransferase family protein [Acidimicrobiales bacterium]|jgi:hypoxanthine phosphoribosyltransferase|nr:phosphoribosyltransferase family protein [Acidimicrobiales bacterium]MDG2904068.1 phosphoribosyltransferase family protein [Acidimicrobiales bacterium]|tara:strand:- start:3025 stop:3633 length:609 start_codon:yes stop_codon:yes gene_type:complete
MRAPYLLRDADAIRKRVAQLAADLTDILDSDSVVVGVLKGCLPFMADLIRSIEHQVEVDFLALTAFAPDSGRVRLTRDLATDVTGRKVVLVEGVVDTGFRLDFLRRHLEAHGPSEIRVCALFDRADRRVLPVPVEHSGFVLEEGFVVGYGLDHRGMFRNLPAVVSLDPEHLEEYAPGGRPELLDEVLRLARGLPVTPGRVTT